MIMLHLWCIGQLCSAPARLSIALAGVPENFLGFASSERELFFLASACSLASEQGSRPKISCLEHTDMRLTAGLHHPV